MLDLRMVLTASAVFLAGCVRDPLPTACPPISVGDLVVSEIRGPQSGSDTLGQWIEIYNATSQSIELGGLTLRMRKLDGSDDVQIIVRAERQIGANGYAVLGRFAEGAEPAYVTYGFLDDFSSSLYSAGAIDVESCGVVIDRVIYQSLPTLGTLSLDGTDAPDATANDDSGSFCTDASGDGHPGTPLERNHPCAP